MKTLLWIFGSLGLVGILFGVFVSHASSKPLVRNGQEAEAQRMIQRVKEAAALQSQQGEAAQLPKARCDEPTFDFGLMNPLTVGSHTFHIENRGNLPLLIRGGESSCKCTLSDLEEAVIAPGGTHPITLTWNSGHASRTFHQTATVQTSDPINREIQLSVSGQVKAVLDASPTAIHFDRLLPATPKSTTIVLYSQIWESFSVERVESTSPHITASIADAATQASSASAAVYARDDEIHQATSAIVITIDYDGQASEGDLSGLLRFYVRPAIDWLAARKPITDQSPAEADSNQPPEISYPVLDDGTVLAEVGFAGSVVKRLSLYGGPVQPEGVIELGKVLAKDSRGKRWSVMGRIRGDSLPEAIHVSVSGIPGLVASVEKKTASQASHAFHLVLELSETLQPAIYDREQAGKLTIETPGLRDSELLEMPINLDVLKEF